jgi:hypothetical protein
MGSSGQFCSLRLDGRPGADEKARWTARCTSSRRVRSVLTMKMKVQAADVADRRRNGRRRAVFLTSATEGDCHCVVCLWGSTPCGLPNCRTDTVCRGAGTDVGHGGVVIGVSPATTCGGDLTDILFSAHALFAPFATFARCSRGRITMSKLTAELTLQEASCRSPRCELPSDCPQKLKIMSLFSWLSDPSGTTKPASDEAGAIRCGRRPAFRCARVRSFR